MPEAFLQRERTPHRMKVEPTLPRTVWYDGSEFLVYLFKRAIGSIGGASIDGREERAQLLQVS